MKKQPVRFLALFLAVCLIFSLGVSAFADDEAGVASPAAAEEPQDITEEVDIVIEDTGITVTVGVVEVTPDEPYPDAENPSVTVTESDTVTIAADIVNEDGTGLTVFAESDGQVQVDAEDITAGDTGVIANISSGAEAEITTGDITVISEEDGAGIAASVIGDGTVEITTGDISVTATGEGAEATGIILTLSDPEDPEEESGIEIVADGDVTAEDTGLLVTVETSGEAAEQTNPATADVLITGTLTAEQAVVVDEYVTEDNLSLTVWKIETPEGAAPSSVVTTEATAVSAGEAGTAAVGGVVGYETAESGAVVNEYNTPSVGTSAAADAFTDASIQYIIKVEAPDAGQGELRAADANGNALSQSHGYDVAKEGETVTLKISVKDGYELTGAFNGEGEDRVEITTKDDAGNYYITVPKGGGIYLSVTLKEKETQPDTPDTPDIPDTPDTPNGGNGNGDGGNPPANTNPVINITVVDEPVVTGTVDGKTVTKKLSDVVKPLTDDMLIAMKEGKQVFDYAFNNHQVLLGSGVVDFNGAFANAQEEKIFIPVSGNYLEGARYVVLLNNWTVMIVTCDKEGVLEIAFPKDAAGLGFVVQEGKLELLEDIYNHLNQFTNELVFESYGRPTSPQPQAAVADARKSTAGAPDTSVAIAGANNGNPTAPGTDSSEREGQIIDWARKNGIIP